MNDQGIIINKKKQNHTVEYISIDQKNIKTSSSVKLLGVHIDDKLNSNLHITKICRSAATQLHALIATLTQVLIIVHFSGCFLAQNH